MKKRRPIRPWNEDFLSNEVVARSDTTYHWIQYNVLVYWVGTGSDRSILFGPRREVVAVHLMMMYWNSLWRGHLGSRTLSWAAMLKRFCS